MSNTEELITKALVIELFLAMVELETQDGAEPPSPGYANGFSRDHRRVANRPAGVRYSL